MFFNSKLVHIWLKRGVVQHVYPYVMRQESIETHTENHQIFRIWQYAWSLVSDNGCLCISSKFILDRGLKFAQRLVKVFIKPDNVQWTLSLCVYNSRIKFKFSLNFKFTLGSLLIIFWFQFPIMFFSCQKYEFESISLNRVYKLKFEVEVVFGNLVPLLDFIGAQWI